ncbi:sulfotransferase family protein [Hyphomonas polymorpha PS728]|uniref:Sulfotransferase family protein n=1 Tax=Hyphomonas polymorpha PS728 TaxID=1280954 RepID=A0A062V974_9PROT|nr:sulfotransferase domain-containing protein [Hyphomonas polymorpha]KCZ96670.1 sulfotransferase family protein [Hyphomonas polymorpha PS728]
MIKPDLNLPARPAMRGRIAWAMRATSAKVNYEWALRRPGKPPFIVLTEYPRSGGNWVRDMVADALQVPAPRFSMFPITFRAIIHSHDHRLIRGHKAIYVLRDGRDCFISHYFKNRNAARSADAGIRASILRHHPSLNGKLSDEAEMNAFFEEWTRRASGSRANWATHVTSWLTNTPPNVTLFRYEDLRSTPEAALAAGITQLKGSPAPDEVIRFAVLRNTFEVQTGRKPGQTDETSTKRQGLAGAWKQEMPAGLQDKFAGRFGRALELAGYRI